MSRSPRTQAVFHANTRKVLQDWTSRRGDRPAPARADIEPGAFKELLPQLFILACADDEVAPFRLAGGLLSDLHGRDLRGVCFSSLFFGTDRVTARLVLLEARRKGEPVVLEATGWTSTGDSAEIEITLAPLTGPGGEMDRMLGLYQPTTSLRRLMGARIEALTLQETRGAEADLARLVRKPAPHLRLVALDGRRLD